MPEPCECGKPAPYDGGKQGTCECCSTCEPAQPKPPSEATLRRDRLADLVAEVLEQTSVTDDSYAAIGALEDAGYVVVPREAVAGAANFMLSTEGDLYPTDQRHLASLVGALSPPAEKDSSPAGETP